MARFRHEQTNRKVKTYKSIKHWNKKYSYQGGWRTFINKYPVKCAVCNKYVGKGIEILWHTQTKLVQHKSDCLV